MTRLRRPIALTLLLLLGACAEVPTDPDALAAYKEANDPAEPTNRAIFTANQAVDRTVLKPVVAAYKDYFPDIARSGIRNFAANLGDPKVVVNDLLQGNFDRAWRTTARFVINSTAGGAGFVDVASRLGLPGHYADFGQTMGVWGIDPGPAVHMPLLGPSNLRDSVGSVLGFVLDPLALIPGSTISTITGAGTAAGMLGTRSDLSGAMESLEKNSLDYYVALRSYAAQRRAAFIEEGKAVDRVAIVEVGSPVVGEFSAAEALQKEGK